MRRLLASAWGHIEPEKPYTYGDWTQYLGDAFIRHCKRATTADKMAKGRGCIQCDIVRGILEGKPTTPAAAEAALQTESHRLSKTLDAYARRERTARQNRRVKDCGALTG